MIIKERAGVPYQDTGPLDKIRLLEEILHVALLLLGGTFPLIRAPLALLAPVPAQGAARFLHSSLGLVIAPSFLSRLLRFVSTVRSLLLSQTASRFAYPK